MRAGSIAASVTPRWRLAGIGGFWLPARTTGAARDDSRPRRRDPPGSAYPRRGGPRPRSPGYGLLAQRPRPRAAGPWGPGGPPGAVRARCWWSGRRPLAPTPPTVTAIRGSLNSVPQALQEATP